MRAESDGVRAVANVKPEAGARPIGFVAAVVFALIWIVVARVPLARHAEAHLDSDLAVDGLTLAEVVKGQWRWHYPGTPHIGIPPVLLSWPQARIWGVNSVTLVSGGIVAYGLFTIAAAVLAARVFGRRAGLGALVPLTFSSTGVIWLSGRITGGHLLVLFWHALALIALVGWLRRPGRLRAFGVGLVCGLGFFIDSMAIFTAVGVGVGMLVSQGRAGAAIVGRWVAPLLLGIFLGMTPRVVGTWVDPYDAYGAQFVSILRPINPADGDRSWGQAATLAVEHARILTMECLPRLIAGHRAPGFQPDPVVGVGVGGAGVGGGVGYALDAATTALALGLFGVALIALAVRMLPRPGADPIASALAWAVMTSSGLIVFAFIVNRNIFNSDNYRYLVFLLLPWSLGVGLLTSGIARPGLRFALILVLALMMTLDTIRWYNQRGWLRGLSVAPVARRDPMLGWLSAHPEVESLRGPYWDVYRLAFLLDRPLRVVPRAGEPNRFPEWGRRGEPRYEFMRPDPEGLARLNRALEAGATELHRTRGLVIVEWPRPGPARAHESP